MLLFFNHSSLRSTLQMKTLRLNNNGELPVKLERDVHFSVPRKWVTEDGKDLDRNIDGMKVVHLVELHRKPGFFSVRATCDTHERAKQILRQYSAPYYRRQGVFCEPYVPAKVRRRVQADSGAPRRHPLKVPRRTHPRRVGSRTRRPPLDGSRIRSQSRSSSERYRSRGSVAVRSPREDSSTEHAIYFDFSPNTLNFEPEAACFDIPTGRHINFSLSEPSGDDDDDDDPEDGEIEDSPVRQRSASVYSNGFSLSNIYQSRYHNIEDVACYDSDSDIPILG